MKHYKAVLKEAVIQGFIVFAKGTALIGGYTYEGKPIGYFNKKPIMSLEELFNIADTLEFFDAYKSSATQKFPLTLLRNSAFEIGLVVSKNRKVVDMYKFGKKVNSKKLG